jgi:hypothetical protein
LKAGAVVKVNYPNSSTDTGTYAAFFTGLTQVFVPITNGMFTIPASLQGTTYVVITSANGTVSDDSILAGPAVVVFNFNSAGKLIEQ